MAAPMNGDTVKDSELVPDEQPVLRGENEGTADSMAVDTVEAKRARCLEESFPILHIILRHEVLWKDFLGTRLLPGSA